VPIVDDSRAAVRPGLSVQAVRLGQVVRGGRRTLDAVSLTVRAGQLVAIIGASGAGKTTLLDALAGMRPPAEGEVRYTGGHGPIGYVPQDDIIHQQLPLARTLHYAARLRLPAADADRRVGEVLDVLGLTGRAGTRIADLSGGERKRASIAVELLARPAALFLDEPTSGLDPAAAADLLALLGRLARDGVPVVLTTHNPADVRSCDTVAVLAPGGRLVFAGPPGAAPGQFGADDVADIYGRLTQAPTWTHPPDPLPDTTRKTGDAGTGAPGVLTQIVLLTGRNLAILRADRLTLAILIGSPLVILAMFLMLFRGGAFAADRPDPGTTVMILFWIAFGVFFFGLTYGLLQICTEQAVLRREVFAGLRLGPYLSAKIAVLLPMLALVDVLLLGVLRALDRLPALPAADFAALWLTTLLASACALALGLLCSASVSDVAQAGLLLPMLCFPQVLFVGAILPVPVMAPVGRWLSYAMSNRWSFEALGHSTGVEQLWASGTSPLGPPLLATYGDTFSRPLWLDWSILTGMTLIFLVAGWGCCAVVPDRFETLRATEYRHLDAAGEVYLDYTGAGVYSQAQLRAHHERLAGRAYGNPHSANPSSAASTDLVASARHAVLRFLNADPAEYAAIFTPNASGACRLVGEAYPFGRGRDLVMTFDNHNSVNGIREYARRAHARRRYLPLSPPDLRVADQTVTAALRRRRGLFAFPAQSNFTGVQHPLRWVEQAHDAGYDVLLDVAAYLPTNPLDLSRVKPDFVPISWYKVLGYPTGVGCLVARRDALARLRRPWFAGGTIAAVSVGTEWHQLTTDETAFEDGTLDFLHIPDVEFGLSWLARLGHDTIHDRVHDLTARLLTDLTGLRHGNDTPMIRLYGPAGPDGRGATIAFNLLEPDGRVVDERLVAAEAAGDGLSLRTGCFCNPGAGEGAFAISRRQLRGSRRWGVRTIDDYLTMIGLPTGGAVRVSFGVASTDDDLNRLLAFLTATYRDRRADSAGLAPRLRC
jgi:selenocysteine lyase/cysteine desulfurase/ABC-type multidrug transport system ATPase subunit